MPDLLAGTTIAALDTPPTVSDTETGSFTYTITSYGVTTTGGTYADCGVAFTAPTTGRVKIDFAGDLDSDTASVAVLLAPVVRTGSTVGSGTVVIAASDDNAILNRGTDNRRFGAAMLVEGLTAGSAYNVRIEHRTGSNTATVLRRTVIVTPCT